MRRSPARPFTALLAACFLLSLWGGGPIKTRAAVQLDYGYEDMSFSAASVTSQSLTSDTVQSKLWHHDGNWFAVLFRNSDEKHHIYRLNMTTQAWTDTGVALDDRDGAKADALAVGDALHVAFSETTAQIRYYRLTYNTSTDAYAVNYSRTVETRSASEVAAKATSGSGPVTVAQDSSGELWLAWTRGSLIRYATSATGSTWNASHELPGGSGLAAGSDVAAVTTVGGDAIGVFWSDQSGDDAFYFIRHIDSDPDTTWQSPETAMASLGEKTATGQFSVKTTSTGEVLAAVKTERDTIAVPVLTDPETALLARASDGTWSSHTVSPVSAGQVGRVVLVIDDDASRAYVFQTVPPGGGAIVERHASLGSLSFGSATPVISDARDPKVKNPTSSKAATGAASGIIVEAEDKTTARYLHGCVGAVCPSTIPPIASFTFTPTSPTIGATITFTDTSVNGPTTWAWDFQNDGVVDSTDQNPTFSYPSLGSKVVRLTVTNGAGSGTTTRTIVMADITGPVVSGPHPYFVVRSTMGAKTVPVRISWSATDPSGLASYKVYQRTGSTGSWKRIATLKAPTHAVVRTLTFGKSYQFRVDAYDKRGNRTIAYSGLFRPLRYQESSGSIVYAGSWRSAASSTAAGGRIRYSKQAGASATFTTTARTIAWVSRTAPKEGSARVYIDGSATPAATINLKTSATKWKRVVFSRTWAVAAVHSIRIVVVGTSGHPRVDVDAFVITR